MSDEKRQPEYLGDGLYADFDGQTVRLFASNGVSTSNEVFLEADSLAALLRYLVRVKTQQTLAPSFTCPKCSAVSYNPNDISQGYCARCDEFTGGKKHV